MNDLTNAERKLAELVIEGLTNKEIAERLHITVHTVKAHLEHIYEKFEIHNKVQLAVKILCKENQSDLEVDVLTNKQI